jgi:hypothetical protein
MIRFRSSAAVLAFITILLFERSPAFAWSNRGHRMINRVAAQTLPADMPAFIRTPEAVREISYLGPEPDRWTQRGLEPELASSTTPDHAFRLELGEQVAPLPRKRYDFLNKLEELRRERPGDAGMLTAQHIGTLPWEAEEIYGRLEASFHTYRIAMDQYSPNDYTELAPITKDDLPEIEASVLFYAGWLGHYIGDGCMPLHTSINSAGWAEKNNPQGYTTKGSIHHNLELVADDAIEQGRITPERIQALVASVHPVDDPFVDTLAYLGRENHYVDDVYQLEKQGKLSANLPETRAFIEARMAEGSAMLRDLIHQAWLDSAALKPVPHIPDAALPDLAH